MAVNPVLERVEPAPPELEPGGRPVLDLRRLDFMGSTGLRPIMRLDLRARAEGSMPAMVREAGMVRDIRLARMAGRVPVVDDPGELVWHGE